MVCRVGGTTLTRRFLPNVAHEFLTNRKTYERSLNLAIGISETTGVYGQDEKSMSFAKLTAT